ncbi:CubicO group peptidase, beta-lactamase class C family [Paractinoplanes atraurantiacus]|uniref:CubicO group peptidase, beta-lactamase class C family n=1 Tax=Paractinoplanes atraurantiacus TaxID=1036182 RepID=A0A285JB14_9ACTN|nr:CubicO group peptidase, beta-lactamase class C family [Actinoplanes atraurantiacus]
MRSSELDEWIGEVAERHQVPGLAVAVGHRGELAEAAAGVVNVETGVATTTDTVFQIGSVTKVWTAVLVMQLVDEGLVDLDQPVRRYLPEFALVDPEATETVTVRQLLLHTGGFDGDLFEDTGRGDDAVGRYLAHLGGHAGQFAAPGTLYSYSNAGYSVLGALVARLRGSTWESVLRERLLEPSGMRHVALLAEEAILFRASAGHWKGELIRPWQLPRSIGPAGASPCAAPRELVRFGRLFLDGKFAAMTTPQLDLPGVPERGARRRGLGPVLYDWDGTTAIGHDGDTMGQATQWRVVPDHDLVVALSTNSAVYRPVFDELLDRIVHELTGVTVPARPAPSGPGQPGPAPFAGRYRFPLATYDVVATGDGFDVTSTPLGFAAQFDENPATEKYVFLSGTTFITARPVDGKYSMLTFLDGGRYLYGGRVAERVDE